jgi:hypothetical protein
MAGGIVARRYLSAWGGTAGWHGAGPLVLTLGTGTSCVHRALCRHSFVPVLVPDPLDEG